MENKLLQEIKACHNNSGVEIETMENPDDFYKGIVENNPAVAIYYSLDGFSVHPIYRVGTRYVILYALNTFNAPTNSTKVIYYAVHSTSMNLLVAYIKRYMSKESTQGKTVYVRQPEPQPRKSNSNDEVNHPVHYTVGGIETIDILKAKLTAEEFKGFLKGNIIKYLCRANHKGKASQDIEKAQWYTNKLVEADRGE